MRNRETKATQAIRIELDLDLANETAEDLDGRDARHRQQLWTQSLVDPLAQRDLVARA
jgi:uncharacterized membrane-anchored protein